MRNAWAKLYDKKVKPKRRKSTAVVTGYRSNVQGWREIGGKKCYFRSLWEIQHAQYLEWMKGKGELLDWEYEPRLFKFPKEPYRSGPFEYLPDFKVTGNDGKVIWHEVKGYMNAASKKKTKRFRKHFPEETLIIIDKTWFTYARKQKLHLIIGWEKLPTMN